MLVMDNLNTHHPASLYEAFEPGSAAHRPTAEIHSPKHGSWLNIAEIELGVLARQCLDRRIPRQEDLARGKSNETGRQFEWTGASPPRTPAFKSLYPSYNSGLLVLQRRFLRQGDFRERSEPDNEMR